MFLGLLICGLGIGLVFVTCSIAALAGVAEREAGLASGLINTSQQIGGALGIAILSTVATTQAGDAIASGTAIPVALTDGFQTAFFVGVGIAAVGVLASLFLVRGRDLEAPAIEPEPALEAV